VGGEAPVTPVSSPDSSSLDLSYKPCDNRVLNKKNKQDFSLAPQAKSKMLGRSTRTCSVVKLSPASTPSSLLSHPILMVETIIDWVPN
jgi:hypothetical protein